MSEDEHTNVSSVQFYGQFERWPENAVYVGMPGKAATAFGIPANLGIFGKPWETLNHPEGWQTGYLRYLVGRLSNDSEFEQAVKNLHGKTLLCWCVAKNAPACHAFLLRELVELLAHSEPHDCATCAWCEDWSMGLDPEPCPRCQKVA